jgi:thioredoxin-related protein
MNPRLFCSLALGLLTAGAQAKPPADWPFQSWDAAVAASAADHRPVFVLFGFEACTWCEYLYQRGMNDDEVKSQYAKHFSLTYVDTKAKHQDKVFTLPGGEKILLKDLVTRYRGYPTPSWIYLSHTGQLLHADRGAKSTARELLKDLETAESKR